MLRSQKEKSKADRENAKRYLQNVTNDREIARLQHQFLFTSLIHVNHKHDNDCHLSRPHPPILSGILPLFDETIVRVSIGSHREKRTREHKYERHDSTVIDVLIPPKYILLFYHEGFIHGGGPGTKQCARIFTVFGPATLVANLENKNYSTNMIPCQQSCMICSVLNSKKAATGNITLPNRSEHEHENKVGTLLYDNTLWGDGFCVLKVIDEKAYKKIPMTQLQNFIKSSKFQSLKQEETMALQKGKRCMLDTSTALNSSEYLEKKLDINVKSFLTKCYEATTSYLKTLTNTNYDLKGHTMLLNKGEVGYQTLHMDDQNKCSCN